MDAEGVGKWCHTRKVITFMCVSYINWSHKAASKKKVSWRIKCRGNAKKLFYKALQMCKDHAGSLVICLKISNCPKYATQ